MPVEVRGPRAVQLAGAWVLFVIASGVYHVPAVLFASIKNDLGLSQSQIALLPTCFLLTKGACALPCGSMFHHFGTHRCIRVGTAALAMAAAAYTLSASLPMLVALHVAYGVAFSLCGLAPLVLHCNAWFERDKSTAIGLLISAFSASGIFWPPLVAVVATTYGWRLAALTLPASVVAVALPLAVLVLRVPPRGRRARHGRARRADPDLAGDGGGGRGRESTRTGGVALADLDSAGAASAASSAPEVASTGSDEALQTSLRRWPSPPWWVRERAVWHLALMSAETLYVVNALTHLLVLYLTEDVGMPLPAAGGYSSVVFACSIAGKLAVGPLLDGPNRRSASLCGCATFALGCSLTLRLRHRLPPASVALPASPMNVTGAVMPTAPADDATAGLPLLAGWELLPASTPAQLGCFAVVYGLGYGATYTLVQSRAAQLFGTIDDFSRLQGFLVLWQYIGSFLGVVVTATLREATGSYAAAFAAFPPMALLVCAHNATIDSTAARGVSAPSGSGARPSTQLDATPAAGGSSMGSEMSTECGKIATETGHSAQSGHGYRLGPHQTHSGPLRCQVSTVNT